MSLTVPDGLTTAEVSARTGIPRRTLTRHLPPELGPLKVGRSIRWSRAAVDAAFPPITEVAA
jgi:predicted DNA-binding transcriptional regulator AlpA